MAIKNLIKRGLARENPHGKLVSMDPNATRFLRKAHGLSTSEKALFGKWESLQGKAVVPLQDARYARAVETLLNATEPDLAKLSGTGLMRNAARLEEHAQRLAVIHLLPKLNVHPNAVPEFVNALCQFALRDPDPAIRKESITSLLEIKFGGAGIPLARNLHPLFERNDLQSHWNGLNQLKGLIAPAQGRGAPGVVQHFIDQFLEEEKKWLAREGKFSGMKKP
ncbi:MAG: hypothetical protein HY917_01475 [Candidatus Diapherotrites archaeon]|nr:hypothetical protein [Candidatus Diapherotrites archaeon]